MCVSFFSKQEFLDVVDLHSETSSLSLCICHMAIINQDRQDQVIYSPSGKREATSKKEIGDTEFRKSRKLFMTGTTSQINYAYTPRKQNTIK